MARGMVPRQPSKSGKQAGARRVGPAAPNRPKSKLAESRPDKTKKTTDRLAAPAGGSRGHTPAKGYNPVAPERVKEILKRLDATYPDVTCALTHENAWQLLVATILSAQCTDERVNKTTPELFRKYPTPQSLAKMEPEQIEADIKSTGFFRNKAKSIVGAARKVVSDFGGEVPTEMDQLLTLPGVARKTANVVLGTWFGKNEGVVVDTHVFRISRRLELTKEDAPEKIEQDLMQMIPRERWTSFSHQVIWHGRKLCVARMPKCAECPLENICHAADKTWSTVEMHKNAKGK
ncbi:MAG: endonuclease III [Terriglobales bacterium]